MTIAMLSLFATSSSELSTVTATTAALIFYEFDWSTLAPEEHLGENQNKCFSPPFTSSFIYSCRSTHTRPDSRSK